MKPAPKIIQGGMGAGVSDWVMARTVSRMQQMGVVSGTAIDVILARRLQMGDAGGHLRRALSAFPVPKIAQRVLDNYFIPEGKADEAPFKAVPIQTVNSSPDLLELTVVAAFVEVFLAKEGHQGVVGINFLEKIQLPMLPSLYGAMLADVDYVLIGAGIPREIPGVLDGLALQQPVSLKLHVDGATREDQYVLNFDPQQFMNREIPGTRAGADASEALMQQEPEGRNLKRPKFIAIIASAVLAITLAKKANGKVDGFVVEGPTAGGHNAPPRGPLQLSEQGEPVYGSKDQVDLDKIKDLGLPFWLAGSYGHPEKLREALALGAAGVQVGTAFAFCRESGIAEEIKSEVLERIAAGETNVFTDPLASSSGFPFKIVRVSESISEAEVYAARPRLCDLGFLQRVYKKGDGSLGYRCPAEPEKLYIKKGGNPEDTKGRKCLCNGLLATIGQRQHQRQGYHERPLVTAGDDLKNLTNFLKPGQNSYTAADVIRYLLDEPSDTDRSSGDA